MLAVVPEWMSSDFHTFILVDIGWFPKFAERGLGGWFFTNTAKKHKGIQKLGAKSLSPSEVLSDFLRDLAMAQRSRRKGAAAVPALAPADSSVPVCPEPSTPPVSPGVDAPAADGLP